MINKKENLNPSPLRTCVLPQGSFIYGLHQPGFQVVNLRMDDFIQALGVDSTDQPHLNQINFPSGDVDIPEADAIFEIANPFPFRGTTYIGKTWADAKAADPNCINIPPQPEVSLYRMLQSSLGEQALTKHIITTLPDPIKLALAVTSTDPQDLILLADISCRFVRKTKDELPKGLAYTQDSDGRMRPVIHNPTLFEAVANNPNLPDTYKEVMVLRPGVQGDSEIVGQWHDPDKHSHIFEYLRCNSYIPWGHYAANMAHDSVRYAVGDLTVTDMTGLRHLYYQRTYLRLAADLNLPLPSRRQCLTVQELERLRQEILNALDRPDAFTQIPFSATLWGWNYGFDYAPSGYRLHASHQQIHQQFAMIPTVVTAAPNNTAGSIPAFACGDMIQSFIHQYQTQTGTDFFNAYQQAIYSNQRMDGRTDRPASLVIHEDEQVMLFVPKAQTAQWELQIMTLLTVGNILEAGPAMRCALDRAIMIAMRILTTMGASMISVIEYSKRLDQTDSHQRLLYAFLPKMPESSVAFSEAQLRWINGHYPEDFAAACRLYLNSAMKGLLDFER